MLPVEDAVTLLVEAARRTPDEMSCTRAELHALARSCGLLPLALRSVGSLLAHLDPADLIEVMSSADHPLRHLDKADQAATAAFDVSYDALSTPLADTLRACAGHPGPDFDAVSVAALTGLPPPLATMRLVELVSARQHAHGTTASPVRLSRPVPQLHPPASPHRRRAGNGGRTTT